MRPNQAKQVGLFALTLTVLLAFQNCLPTNLKSTNSSQASQSASGNGDGYGGKVTSYINRSGALCGDGSDIKSKIVVENDSGKALLVRKDCSDVLPVALSLPDVGLMPHNPANVIYDNTVFDQETSTLTFSSLFCRGKASDLRTAADVDQPPELLNEMVDAVIYSHNIDGQQSYTGRVILGIYDSNWVLQKTFDMGEVKVSSPGAPVEGRLVFNSLSLHDHRSTFTLIVNETTLVGDLSYLANLQDPDPSQPGAPPPSDGFYTAHGLSCYRQ